MNKQVEADFSENFDEIMYEKTSERHLVFLPSVNTRCFCDIFYTLTAYKRRQKDIFSVFTLSKHKKFLRRLRHS